MLFITICIKSQGDSGCQKFIQFADSKIWESKTAMTEGSIISAGNNNGFASASSRLLPERVQKFNENKKDINISYIYEESLCHELP